MAQSGKVRDSKGEERVQIREHGVEFLAFVNQMTQIGHFHGCPATPADLAVKRQFGHLSNNDCACWPPEKHRQAGKDTKEVKFDTLVCPQPTLCLSPKGFILWVISANRLFHTSFPAWLVMFSRHIWSAGLVHFVVLSEVGYIVSGGDMGKPFNGSLFILIQNHKFVTC
ncbi:unnamed protein product [Protopolystoma xenopodis]|uniref:Uncharacterized protein n=1 Tax=Protopolystoma xenopodis TaxID=117903 RepID=A0A448X1Q2_9PLAT|nr:unnamed protein product [Protopolystoma xenopodis]